MTDLNLETAQEAQSATPGPDRLDVFIALGIGLLIIMIYGMAMAPDILYSDSGEFQTLAYTWGTTHSTGYPVYLLLARIVGLLPLNTEAWRITFFSVIAAGVTGGILYLLVRFFTQRAGALLSSVVLVFSYTFWSQSIIAEVYTPAMAFISIILLLLMIWSRQPTQRRWLIFVAGMLVSVGLGVHLFLALIIPAVLMFVLWGKVFGSSEERANWRQLAWLAVGGITGLVIFFLLFTLIDTRSTPTNFFETAMIPSRDAWNLNEGHFDSPLERFWISVSGVQWRDAMLPEDADYNENWKVFFGEYLPREYTSSALILAVLGVGVTLVWHRRQFALIAVFFIVAFVAGLVYHPGDKYIFYLPVYFLIGLLAGVGTGYLLIWITAIVPLAIRPVATGVTALGLIALCIAPMLESRWEAVKTGESQFVTENYSYPVEDLDEPRRAAECAVSKVTEDNAYLVLEWRALYSIYYVAHVEQGRTGLEINEVKPHGTNVITQSLMAEIAARIEAGIPVYVDKQDPQLQRVYNLTSVRGDCRDYMLFRLAPRS